MAVAFKDQRKNYNVTVRLLDGPNEQVVLALSEEDAKIEAFNRLGSKVDFLGPELDVQVELVDAART